MNFLSFIFAMCMAHDIPNCEQAYFGCVDRVSQDRHIEDPLNFCKEAMAETIKNKIREKLLYERVGDD